MSPRQFVRAPLGARSSPEEVAAAIREALDVDGVAEIHDTVEGSTAFVFELHRRGIAVVALAPDGRHLGTWADPVAGILHTFATLDRAARESPSPRARHRRSSRRTTTGGVVG